MSSTSPSSLKFVSISEIDEDTRYNSLISNYGIETDAKIGYGVRGRGLFSTKDLEAGDCLACSPSFLFITLQKRQETLHYLSRSNFVSSISYLQQRQAFS